MSFGLKLLETSLSRIMRKVTSPNPNRGYQNRPDNHIVIGVSVNPNEIAEAVGLDGIIQGSNPDPDFGQIRIWKGSYFPMERGLEYSRPRFRPEQGCHIGLFKATLWEFGLFSKPLALGIFIWP
ncbi:hypothetical protein AVEN_233475-1 [Araneus ventricosus]|uniref:Uncharacterized protein n=1 Tax=Araneus ventricosus TaxID=182803 RepID=A0A4Y2W217_ARAVE|nr:hypothetical protein AVEN_233475-1 [Araneus ventricosus]